MNEEKPDSCCGPDGSEESVSGPGLGEDPSDGPNWDQHPQGSPEGGSTISPALAEETLHYMILSARRVEQMTRTYCDLDMVTHLLTERDRDLELAARIGQSLLQRNRVLQERNQSVEEQLTQALDQVQQLQHVLCKKEELLRMVASVSEECETDSICSTPQQLGMPLPTVLSLSQLEALQKKLQQMEQENQALRAEACHLETETISYEEKEQQLVNDCVRELRESNSQIMVLTDELAKKSDDLHRHQEDMTQLLSQMVDLQQRAKELALEKEELRIHLQHAKDAQRQLTTELGELRSRNEECIEMLQESQEEVKQLRSRTAPSAGLRRHQSFGLIPMDCLAGEIEVSMRRQLSMEGEFAVQDQKDSQKRVFQTVRAINESPRRLCPRALPGSAHSSVVMSVQPGQSCAPAARPRSTEEATPTTSSCRTTFGQPGNPGGSDLTSALHRLSLRRQNFLCERQFHLEERQKKLQVLEQAGQEGEGPEEDREGRGCCSPSGNKVACITSQLDLSSAPSTFKTFLPEKLQIVKPMEGSFTLHQWQQLAQPNLAAILDPHPGVLTKGFRPLSHDTEYRLTDPEEDEEEEDEDEMGITFRVQCASTPVERREREMDGKSERTPVFPSVTWSSLSQPSVALPHSPVLPPAPSVPPSALQQSSGHIFNSPAPSPAHNPGKCLSSTFSTFTFTTCQILHPSDITQVTPSSGCVSSDLDNTPSSLRSVPSTPVTPYRLSLGNCPAPPQSLAQLLLERGISATEVSTDKGHRNPMPGVLPNTVLDSSSHSPPPPPLSADNFLASRPAEVFLQKVHGLKLGRLCPDPPDPSTPLLRDRVSFGLVERLHQLGLAGVLQGAGTEWVQRPQDMPTFLATGGGSLLTGLRRNHSLPCMVGGLSQSAYGSSHLPPFPHSALALPITPWDCLKGPPLLISSSTSSASSSSTHTA
ncbi:hypothetical protein GJAV_G00207900 [Gymnothorax javanicus]|nr:hypothetical protein GJAV_G00207900 [Gymnothorax javanicus]